MAKNKPKPQDSQPPTDPAAPLGATGTTEEPKAIVNAKAKKVALQHEAAVASAADELAALKAELATIGDPSLKRKQFNDAYRAKLAEVTAKKEALDKELRLQNRDREKIFRESQAGLARVGTLKARIDELEAIVKANTSDAALEV